MKLTTLFLPAVALGAGAMLLAPTGGFAFSTIGGDLDLTQRDVRIFNNFTDVSANNNQVPDPQFPGHQGAVMALWKSTVEWGSELHGNGNGDPLNPGDLGSGNANFDGSFQGEATGVGTSNDNIHSEISGGGGGVLAFTETPISNGWRIRYYANWNWSDGPGSAILNQKDLQGVGCHEYGHALGLGHTSVSGAVMFPSTFSGNNQRDLVGDDQAGVQFIYGAKSAFKPTITNVSIAGSTVTITGTNFDLNNNEVWFTNQAQTATNQDPIVRATGIGSTGGTLISLQIPDLAGPGDVLVKIPGTAHSQLSNAFPLDGMGAGPTAPTISSVSPPTIEAVNVGTAQIVSINGAGFLPATTLTLDGQPVTGFPSPYTVVSPNLITFDPPEPIQLGQVTLSISNINGSDSTQVNRVANATPALQAGTGDEPVSFFSFAGIDLTVGYTPGSVFLIAISFDCIPSVLPGLVSLEIGNGFTSLFPVGPQTVIGPDGWEMFNLPSAPGLPPGTTFFIEGIALDPVPVFPIPDSNKQEVQLLF